MPNSKSYLSRNWLIAGTALASLVFFISVLFNLGLAQNPSGTQGFEVSPPSQDLNADPGQTVTARAKIRNSSNNTVAMTVRIEDFTAQGEAGQVALIDNGPYSLTSWTTVDPKSFTLKAGETKEVVATINVPKGSAGGRYGSFVFSAGGAASPGTAAISQEVASLFLVRISGPVSEKLDIAEFTAPSFLEFGPVPLNLKFVNTGNVHVKPFGLINVRDIFGHKVADIVVPASTNIFPGASRVVNASLDQRLLFGPFTAQAVLNYGSKNESLTAATTFFVFPVRLTIAVILAVVVLFLLRGRLRKAGKALAGK
jgi:hypothetical protein